MSIQTAAEIGQKIKESDSGFISLIVGEIHKDVYGLYFTYKSSAPGKNPDMLLEKIRPILKSYEKYKAGHQISNKTLVIK